MIGPKKLEFLRWDLNGVLVCDLRQLNVTLVSAYVF